MIGENAYYLPGWKKHGTQNKGTQFLISFYAMHYILWSIKTGNTKVVDKPRVVIGHGIAFSLSSERAETEWPGLRQRPLIKYISTSIMQGFKFVSCSHAAFHVSRLLQNTSRAFSQHSSALLHKACHLHTRGVNTRERAAFCSSVETSGLLELGSNRSTHHSSATSAHSKIKKKKYFYYHDRN